MVFYLPSGEPQLAQKAPEPSTGAPQLGQNFGAAGADAAGETGATGGAYCCAYCRG